MAKFAVIGLGKMGSEAARTLADQGAEVIAIDNSKELVERIKDHVAATVILDGTDDDALREIHIEDVDAAIVTMGDSMEASILSTLILKEMGVVEVIARAISDSHARVLEKIGADKVVQPEREMGRRLAHIALTKSVREYVELPGGLGVTEILASAEMVGRSLAELDFRRRYQAMVLGIRRGEGEAESLVTLPQAAERIEEGDRLVVTALEAELQKLIQGK